MADGPSFVTETIYPARFRHVDELKNMGANIEADMETGTATIKPSSLNGAEVYASDLRAGACLIIAGLLVKALLQFITLDIFIEAILTLLSI